MAAMWPDWSRPEQVPRTTDLQVAEGDLETGTQLGVVADGSQPLIGLLGEHPVDRVEEVGVGPLAGPADPAPQLVELAQAEQVGPVHHQGVDRRHVDSRLDDGGAHQHVVLRPPRSPAPPSRASPRPSGRGPRPPGPRGPSPAHALGHRLDVLDPVVDVEDLALAQQLAADGLGGRRLLELADVGEDRPAGRRRGVDHRQVTDAGQGHLEGPRDGAGGEGEHVDPVGQRLDRLLVGDPEPLLLVHHQQAELLEGDVLPQQAVGPDHHVHRPVGQAGQHRFGLGVGQEPAQHLDLDREGRVPVGEGLGVLAGQAAWWAPAPRPGIRPAPP